MDKYYFIVQLGPQWPKLEIGKFNNFQNALIFFDAIEKIKNSSHYGCAVQNNEGHLYNWNKDQFVDCQDFYIDCMGLWYFELIILDKDKPGKPIGGRFINSYKAIQASKRLSPYYKFGLAVRDEDGKFWSESKKDYVKWDEYWYYHNKDRRNKANTTM
jgi:hypothetical protein